MLAKTGENMRLVRLFKVKALLVPLRAARRRRAVHQEQKIRTAWSRSKT